MQQGLASLEATDGSAVLAKPLTVFYAMENLAKSCCLVRDQNLGPDQIRFHGLGGDRETKRYSVKNFSSKVYTPRLD